MTAILKSIDGHKFGLSHSGDLVVNAGGVNRQITKMSQVGSKNGSTVTCQEYGDGINNYTVLTCTALPITIADDAGVAQYGGVKVYDFPAGLIKTDGAIVSGSITGGVTGTIIDTWAGVIALGTATASTGSTLTSTEADYMPSVAIAAATAKVAAIDAVSVATALTESGARWLDGTATAKDMFINIAVADDATHTAGTVAFTGTIKFAWTFFGDN